MATKKAETAKTSKDEAPKAKAAPKASKKVAAGDAPAKKPNAALMKPLTPSRELAAVVGHAPLPRTEVVSKVWEYIRKHNLQNPENKREIVADGKLKAVFGQDKCSMFEMNKFLSAHLK